MKKLIRIIKEELWSLYQFLFLFWPGRVGHYTRGYFLSIFFKKRGKKITIKENVEIYHPENLVMGNKSGFGRNNIIDCIGGITIGDNVRFGPAVMIATMNHANKETTLMDNVKILKPVTIGSGTWIGHNVTILPGANIGCNCIIAAGAVVTKDIPDNSIAAGIPAKVINKSM
ncbi:acyltransferase [Providencia sp. PROV144]|uniref:acyltransferase n=1 Tax=Providencia sp. PROV144 TaxID=2949854 RepID=UPI00234A2D8C|nr:acyltransferase [Providencia sp. PROV144]